MDWDLITERNVQLFIRLAGLEVYPLARNMVWQRGQYETHLGYVNGRVHLSQIYLCLHPGEEMLARLLSHWLPTKFAGIPQRMSLTRRGVAISCSPPTGSSAELWWLLHRRQITFLESQCLPV